MKLVTKEMLEEILSHYPQENHQLVKHQITEMEAFIRDNKKLYITDKSYQRALDEIFKGIIEGKFILNTEN